MRVCGNPDSGLLVIQAMDARQLERLEDEVRALQDMGGTLPLWAAFAVEDWNDALSPWPAPPVFGGHGFGGHAEETLAYIQNTLIPECFTAHHLAEQTKIMLCGYSLAGLFALWAGSQSERFSAVAGVSPSVWFPGCGDYEQAHPIRAEHVYLSLGDREEQTKPRDGGCRKRNPRAVCAAANAKDGLRAGMERGQSLPRAGTAWQRASNGCWIHCEGCRSFGLSVCTA